MDKQKKILKALAKVNPELAFSKMLEQSRQTIIRGEKGVKGDKGDKGEPGKTGDRGLSIRGDRGPKGDKGDRGFDGNDGIPGKDGVTPDLNSELLVGKINLAKSVIKQDKIDGLKEILDSLNKKSKDKGGKIPWKEITDIPAHLQRGGGLSFVTTDATLTGTGTSSSPLHVVGGGGGSGTVDSVTDGVTTVTDPTQIEFTSGGVVTDLGGGIAGVAIGGLGGILNPRGNWTAQTIYAVNDIVVDDLLPYGGAWRCIVAHTSSNVFQSQIVLGYWEQWSARKDYYEVMDYGAKVDGSTDDFTAITAAITAAFNDGGGMVHIPRGFCMTSQQIVLKKHVWLVGDGMFSTVLKLLNASNVASIVTNFVSPDGIVANADFVAVLNMTLDGNKANQSSGTGHGVIFSTFPLNSTATNDELFDMHQLVQNVQIRNARGDGVNMSGRSENRCINVLAAFCGSNGFTPSYDTFFDSCTSESSGLAGFNFSGHSNIQAINCKSFLSGQGTANSGVGFLFTGCYACVISNCNAQQNLAQGFFVTASQNISISGCMSEENSFQGTGGAFAGFDLTNSSYCVVTGESDNISTTLYQANALNITGTSNFNSIILSHAGTNGGSVGTALTSGSLVINTTSNYVIINGANVAGTNIPITGALNQASFTAPISPTVLVIDGVPYQKTQKDGTVNWTGTTSITLTSAPQPSFDIFGE